MLKEKLEEDMLLFLKEEMGAYFPEGCGRKVKNTIAAQRSQ